MAGKTSSFPCQDFADDISFATSTETVLASNVRHGGEDVFLPLPGLREHKELLAMLVEMMWLASVNVNTRLQATVQRRQLLNTILGTLETQSTLQAAVERRQIYGLVMFVGGDTPTYLRSDFVVRFLTAMNYWDPDSSSYPRRARFESLLRNLLSPVPLHIDEDANSNPSSNLTCHHNGATLTEVQPPLRRGRHPETNLDSLPGAAISGVAAAGANSSVDSVGYHLSGDSTTDEDSIIARFRRGEYEALQNMDTDQVIRALSSNVAVLRSILMEPPEDNDDNTIVANEGHTNDFSSPDQKPKAK